MRELQRSFEFPAARQVTDDPAERDGMGRNPAAQWGLTRVPFYGWLPAVARAAPGPSFDELARLAAGIMPGMST